MADVYAILRLAGYRARSRTCNLQRLETSRRLVRDGFTAEDMARLWTLACADGESPAGLFASWIDRRRLAVKLEELRVRGNRFAAPKTREGEVRSLLADLAMRKGAAQ